MQCHYEVLSVGKEATDDEIKKSYRKLALVWHPDKNPDKTEESTKRFLLIQQAYDVLIDPQERAWYDKHREAILRGGLGRGDDYEDNCVDLYKFFNASCFTGYGDDDCGFYSVYAQVFKSISAEDSEFLDLEAGTTLAPEFGSSQSSYEEVVGPFYAYWESYCTAKSYVWAEKYDTRDAPNRQVRRLMEQDNKKLRDKAKKERNEEVRTLVAFVRKRDRRVQAYKKKLEERATEIAKLAEQRKQRDREERLKILENYRESHWSSMTALEHELQSLEANYAKQFGEVESEEDEGEGDEAAADQSSEEVVDGEGEAEADEYDLVLDDALYCVACDKVFKSEKALDNHKRSKKHNENIDRLRTELMDDDSHTADGNIRSNRSDEKADDDETVNLSVSKSKSKKQKKKRKQMQRTQQNLCEGDDEGEDDNANVINDSSSLKNENKEENEVSESCSESINQPSLETSSEAKPVKEEPGSKSKKRESKQRPNNKTKAVGVPLTCNRCHEEFQSRNKLFEHITATGHELRLANESSSSSSAAAATTERSGASQRTKGKQKRKTKD